MSIQRLTNYTNIAFFLLLLCTAGKLLAASQAAQDAVNFEEIKQYAILANAAYQAPDRIREMSLPKGYKLSHYSNIPAIEISGFLLTNDVTRTQIIAVRGTSNIENAIIDVALELTLDKHTGVRLHNGFSAAAQAIYADIQPQLKPDYTIVTTGHSLGGAVALILAMHMDVDNFTIGQVVTFGQPKVTNITGANKFRHLNVFRVVTQKDLVPLVPPLDPVDLNNIDIYWHQGKEVLLLPDTTYAVLEGISSMLRVTGFTQQPLSENNIHNHQMSLYLALIDKKIPVATLVPFKNSFNLFNLFGSEEK